MKKNLLKLLTLVLALVMVVTVFAGCKKADEETDAPTQGSEETPTETQEQPADEYKPSAAQLLNGKEWGKDFTELYDEIGDKVTIDDVQEDPTTGLAYVEYEGKTYELGMDFLSMAMVYKTAVPENSQYETEDDVYAAWWKYYMTRWNYLLPEIPLYSNEYYDVYNAQIKGVDEHPTNPYWGPAKALIDWTSEKTDKDIIIGNTTDLSGKFRYSNFGGSNPGASDLDVDNLINGMETVATTKEGGFEVNKTVVKQLDKVENEDGTLTYTITLNDGLLISDGTPVTVKNYVVFPMVFSSPVGVAAAGKDHQSGMTLEGFKTFNTYDGTEGSGTKELAGLRMIDDYTYSITVSADYANYFYAISYAGLSAYDVSLWIGDADVKDDGNGVYFTDDFYAKEGDKYVMADHIVTASQNTDTTYPYSGPYVVKSYDSADKSAVLELNPNFKGNYEGVKPTIAKVVYKKIVSSTQLEDLKAGTLDVIAGITGGDETNEALALADGSDGKYVYTHYSRAGYGKLQFRNDYGPAQFTAVRQAITYCLDRASFAKTFTGGYGGIVDGAYYAGSWMYKAAVDQGMILNAYATSVDSAIEVLTEGGWVYDAEGNDYVEGVRYKKIPGDIATENDINYKSKDGAYVTTKVGDDYYMPLVLNWYGTSDNPFTDQLMTGFASNDNVIAAGFNVQYTIGDFSPMLDELYQAAVYGYYSGSPMYSVFNFATGFTSAAYDYSYQMTIDPAMYDDYSAYYIKDQADIFWLK